jgi:hypothetical protein
MSNNPSLTNDNAKFVQYIVLINIIFLFTRPQVYIPILADIKITIVFFLIAFAFWLTRLKSSWLFPTKLMISFIILHAIFIFIGRYVYDPFIINDGRAFYTWKSLVQIFFCFLFPVLSFCQGARGNRLLVIAITYCGFFLGLYAATHNGFGPQGFVGDENDVCIVIVTFLAIPILLLLQTKSIFKKIIYLIIIFTMLAGIITTHSRGGFVGLVIMLTYLWWLSPRKVVLAFVFIITISCTIPFVPDAYWNRMKTIAETDKGTALKRREMWATGLKASLDFPNFLTGVGLDNIPWRMGDYEDIEFGTFKPSMAGRAVHSLPIQIIADLGLIGVLMIGSLVVKSINGNRQTIKLLRLNRRKLLTDSNSKDSKAYNKKKYVSKNNMLEKINYAETILTATNAAWSGLLAAGFFISVLYYPTLWFLVIVSTCQQQYGSSLNTEAEEYI